MKYSQIKKKCENCKNEFKVIKSYINARFCSSKCYGVWRSDNFSGENHPNWKGGIHIGKRGYKVFRKDRKHHYLHHLIWREHNNYMNIPKEMCIHHINLDKLDNRIENLIMLPKNIHSRLHWAIKKEALASI